MRVQVSEELVRDGQLKQILMGISAASVRKKQRALVSTTMSCLAFPAL